MNFGRIQFSRNMCRSVSDAGGPRFTYRQTPIQILGKLNVHTYLSHLVFCALKHVASSTRVLLFNSLKKDHLVIIWFSILVVYSIHSLAKAKETQILQYPKLWKVGSRLGHRFTQEFNAKPFFSPQLVELSPHSKISSSPWAVHMNSPNKNCTPLSFYCTMYLYSQSLPPSCFPHLLSCSQLQQKLPGCESILDLCPQDSDQIISIMGALPDHAI